MSLDPVRAIVEEAACLFKVRARDLLSNRRDPSLYEAHFAIAWVAHHGTTLLSKQIAFALRRDRTAIGHRVRRAAELRASRDEFRDITDRLLEAAEARSAEQ